MLKTGGAFAADERRVFMTEGRYLAIDFGAESGRGVVGSFDGERLSLEEVHRFPTGAIRMGETLHWDLPLLLAEARHSIAGAARTGALSSIGVDTWGVDFGLLGPRQELVGLPVHYRDPRTDGFVEKVFARVPRAEDSTPLL